jgi:hypothetical protein
MQILRVTTDIGTQYINTEHIQRFYESDEQYISIELVSGTTIQIIDISIDSIIEKLVYK